MKSTDKRKTHRGYTYAKRRFFFLVIVVWAMLAATGISAAGQSGNGALKVTSFPSGANVTIDGIDTGKTTPMSTSLTLGDHTVVVSIPGTGWNPDTRMVAIVSGNNDLSVTLLPLGSQGPQGPKGDKGDKGDPGQQGPPGEGGGFGGVREFFSSGEFTVPAGVTHLLIEAWGAGGGGGGGTAGSDDLSNVPFSGTGGGGGSAGGYVRSVVEVTPGSTYEVTIGPAGVGGTFGGDGTAGGATQFTDDTGVIVLVSAGGGKPGQGISPGLGLNTANVGTIQRIGGSGLLGKGPSNCLAGNTGTGGSGGAAPTGSIAIGSLGTGGAGGLAGCGQTVSSLPGTHGNSGYLLITW